MIDLVHACLDGDLAGAKKAQQTVAPLARLIYSFGEPGGGAHQRMKIARWLMGAFPSPTMRRPLRPLPQESVQRIADELRAIGCEARRDPEFGNGCAPTQRAAAQAAS